MIRKGGFVLGPTGFCDEDLSVFGIGNTQLDADKTAQGDRGFHFGDVHEPIIPTVWSYEDVFFRNRVPSPGM